MTKEEIKEEIIELYGARQSVERSNEPPAQSTDRGHKETVCFESHAQKHGG